MGLNYHIPDEKELLSRMRRLCSVKEYSKRNIITKLERYDLPNNTIQSIVSQLEQENFLNEERFCRAFVRDKFFLQHWGSNKIKYELKIKHHIEANIIAGALSMVLTDDDQLESLIEILKTKERLIKESDPIKRRFKLTRFAIGRGFDYSVINRALKVLVDSRVG